MKTDLPLQPGFHPVRGRYSCLYGHQLHPIVQSESGAFGLRLTTGMPTPAGSGRLITYDGLTPSLKGVNGMPLLAFSLPIAPPP